MTQQFSTDESTVCKLKDDQSRWREEKNEKHSYLKCLIQLGEKFQLN